MNNIKSSMRLFFIGRYSTKFIFAGHLDPYIRDIYRIQELHGISLKEHFIRHLFVLD